ncbi:MAG: sigma-70 family RNA polymerase sigma factor [Pyrinomonadaceae bacterium]
MSQAEEITELLQAWSRGDSQAFSQLVPLVDHELRKIAHAFMSRERGGHTLETTALVNEAWMRFITGQKIDWESRTHFYALVARRMRQILIDHARQQLAAKRGNRGERVDLTDVQISNELSDELMLLDEALTKLAALDPRKAHIVEYRYFGGFTVSEIAKLMAVSQSTVEREWRLARSWLKRQLATTVPEN